MIYRPIPDDGFPAKKTGVRTSGEKALQKIKHYCGYQERSHAEVKEKLYSFGLWKNEVEALISQLIEENYLNEERFAIAFAGGRFRIKKWGRVKIRIELKKRKLSEYCIRKALEQINEADYKKTLKTLFQKKWAATKEADTGKRLYKVSQYLVSRGFEPEYVREAGIFPTFALSAEAEREGG